MLLQFFEFFLQIYFKILAQRMQKVFTQKIIFRQNTQTSSILQIHDFKTIKICYFLRPTCYACRPLFRKKFESVLFIMGFLTVILFLEFENNISEQKLQRKHSDNFLSHCRRKIEIYKSFGIIKSHVCITRNLFFYWKICNKIQSQKILVCITTH